MPSNSISKLEECIGNPMLAVVSYYSSGTGSTAFVYPRFVRTPDGFRPVDSSVFPDLGNIVVKLPIGANIENKVGTLAVAVLRSAEGIENQQYPDNPSKFATRLAENPRHTATFSLTRLSDHPMYSEIFQVVEAKEDARPSTEHGSSITITPVGNVPVSKYVLLETQEGSSIFYWGPFEYRSRASGELVLTAVDEYDYQVVRVNALDLADRLAVKDWRDLAPTVATFIPTSTFVPEMRKSPTKLDWLPRQKLVDAVGHVLQSIEDAGLSKNMRRRIKSAIGVCSEETARLNLTEGRRRRLEDVLSNVEYFQDLPPRLKEQIVDNVSEETLARVALEDTSLPVVREMLEASPRIQQRIDAEREKTERLKETMRKEREEARQRRDEAIEEAQTAERRAQEIQQRAIDERKAEISELDENVSRLRAEQESAQADLEKALEDKGRIEEEVAKIVGELHDEVALSSDVLKSELLRKVVAGVAGASDGLTTNFAPQSFVTLRDGEEKLSDREVADELGSIVNDEAGRDYKPNEIVNFFVCLAQGYITTFAGMPGTGKTSLCRILAGALGLLNDQNPSRLCEIAVENGWTSYRDYIGYHNPLTRRYEVADPEVYGAFARLSSEARTNVDAEVPFVFLLDEANLSPLEHYWSPFLHACDTALDRGARLSLGGEEDLLVPRYARFLATVNFDHTTEALSPRFLDRSWVVTLDSRVADFDLDEPDTVFDPSGVRAFSYERLMQAFGGGRERPALDPTLVDTFREVVGICSEARRPISQRSQRMVMRYLSAASPLMETGTADSRYAPLDYALMQKVLPMMAGPVEEVAALLKALGDRCADLPMTSEKVVTMLEMGEDSGFVQFFA